MKRSDIKTTVKPVLSGHSKKKTKIGFQDRLSLNAGQKYCRMLSATLSTFIKLPFVVKIFVLSILEWPLKTGFYCRSLLNLNKGYSECLRGLSFDLGEIGLLVVYSTYQNQF